MTWFVLTLSCIVMWGITYILFKVSSDYNDPLAHYKNFVWVGIIMALAGGMMITWSDTLGTSIETVKDNLYLMPLCLVYAGAFFFGLLGIKYLDASVVSPLENIDGGLAAIIMCLYFMLNGYSNITSRIGVLVIIAAVVIVVGVVFLGLEEHKLSKQEANLPKEKKRHRLGALALIFPLIYNLADAVSMIAVGITVSAESEINIPDIDFFIFECAGFVLAAIFVWLYMLVVKKYAYIPFEPEEMVRCGAATGETFGTMFFILAAARNPILTAPVTSTCCLVTIVLARVFLKERLTKKQSLSVALLVIGIALFGLSEIF